MHRENVIFQNVENPNNSNSKLKCYCDSNSLDYYQEIEKYKSQLKESHSNSSRLENEISDIKDRYKIQMSKLNDEISRHKEKYERLHESHKRISRLNHDLEERILNLIEQFNCEKSEFKENYKEILSKYESSQSFTAELQSECERYRNDCIVAVQLLQNNPGSFLSRPVETKAVDMRHSFEQGVASSSTLHCASAHFSNSSQITCPCTSAITTVPVPLTPPIGSTHTVIAGAAGTGSSSNNFISLTTFPPTAMMYSDYHQPIDQKSINPHHRRHNENHVCASVLAEVLHPDKVAHHEKNAASDSKCTIEVVCTKCGMVKDFRNVSVQTIPQSLETDKSIVSLQSGSKSSSRKAANHSVIFDV